MKKQHTEKIVMAFVILALIPNNLWAQNDTAVDPEIPATPFPPRIEIERNDKKIIAIKYGPDDKGLSKDCIPDDPSSEAVTRSVYYDISPYFVHVSVDKNLIRAPIVYVRKKNGGDGELEAYSGTATPQPEGSEECLPIIQADPKPKTVFVEQGKTQMVGSRLDYSETTGLAIVSGPIEFKRPQENDELKGISDKITVDVDNEKTFLEGNVTLSSRCRTSTATKVEYDDIKNVAYLEGTPAISKQLDAGGNVVGEIKGERIEYFLETNDVIVLVGDSVTGTVGRFDENAPACK